MFRNPEGRLSGCAFPCRQLSVSLALAAALGARAEAATPAPSAPPPAASSTGNVAATPDGLSPWAVNLQIYLWMAGVKGTYSVGPVSRSVDSSFIDTWNASNRVPLGFMGRLEAKYEDFGLYLDGNWMSIDYKPRTGPLGFITAELDTTLSIFDYGFMYRVSGPPDRANWSETASTFTNRLDVYVGGRSIWLNNTITPQRFQSFTASRSFTVPVFGGRFQVDFGRDWFLKADANLGGFGADQVDFTGGLLGSVGYRVTAWGTPLALELGYKAVRVDISNEAIRTRSTLNGPFAGLTAYW